jgi:hypothetical protein
VYLTDGVFLFRIVGFFPEMAGEMVELEDCYGLEVVHVRIRDLRARGLRVVTPAPADAGPAANGRRYARSERVQVPS